MLGDKSDCVQEETMIGCRSHSWVAPQGCLGGSLGGSGFGGLLPHFVGGNRGTGRAARAAGSFRLS